MRHKSPHIKHILTYEQKLVCVYTFTFIVLTSDLIKIMIFVFFQFVRYFNYNVKSGIIGINQVVLDQLYDETERPKLQKTLKSLECND